MLTVGPQYGVTGVVGGGGEVGHKDPF